MHHRVRRRSDGLLEIRPPSWRDSVTIGNPGVLGGLVVACVLCTSLLIACVVYVALSARHRTSALLFGAIALAVLGLRRAAVLRHLRST
jgi:hypothetical protein